jgi:acyl-CoA thioesterase I
MHFEPVLCRVALFWAIAATAILPFPARAQAPGAIRASAVLPSSASMHRPVACAVTTHQVRFDRPLPRIGRLLASGKPIKIVALGSSSTYGAGASTSAASYPSRLAEELASHFPGHEITVLNRGGNNGEDVAAMLARLDSAVIAENPIWRCGSLGRIRCCGTKHCRRTPRLSAKA